MWIGVSCFFFHLLLFGFVMMVGKERPEGIFLFIVEIACTRTLAFQHPSRLPVTWGPACESARLDPRCPRNAISDRLGEMKEGEKKVLSLSVQGRLMMNASSPELGPLVTAWRNCSAPLLPL